VLVLALLGSAWIPRLRRGATTLREVLDPSALRSPRFLAMALVPVGGAIGFVTLLTYLPSALGAVHSLPAGAVGLLMLTMTLPVLIAPVVVHRLMERTHLTPKVIVVASFACLLGGGVAEIVLLRPDLPLAAGVAPMILLGLGFGLPLGFVDAEALAAVPAERAGAASGVVNLLRIGSEALFVALYAAVLAAVIMRSRPGEAGQVIASGGVGDPWLYRDGFVAAALTMTGLVLLVGTAFVVLVRRSVDERVTS
jgi:hypothetical protein